MPGDTNPLLSFEEILGMPQDYLVKLKGGINAPDFFLHFKGVIVQ